MDAQSQQLPAKEATLFRQVVKFYETKQYKKGIKAADQVATDLITCTCVLLCYPTAFAKL
jgi:hypothetical protein